MGVLTVEQREHFDEHGYVVMPGVVPFELVRVAVGAIVEQLGVDLNDPGTWYRRRSWVVPISQHEALWRVREHPSVYQVFAELLGTPHLWVSIDRACFKPPIRDEDRTDDSDGFLHFDRHPETEAEILQGVVALSDTPAGHGGFHCAPSSYRNARHWLEREDFDADDLSLRKLCADVLDVSMNAGDLLVFSSRLAHGNSKNESATPRIAQYVTMFPSGTRSDARVRVDDFNSRLPPGHFRRDDTKSEPGEPPVLSSLGRKLLGVDPW